jgi:uncharacterized protein DUF1028
MRALASVPSRPSTSPIRASDHCARSLGIGRGRPCGHAGYPRNIVRSPEVLRAMTAAFEQTYGMPIAPRLIGALRAEEGAGGEMRPIASAALIVVHTRSHLLPSICASTIAARRSRSSYDCGRSINRRSTPTWCARLLAPPTAAS